MTDFVVHDVGTNLPEYLLSSSLLEILQQWNEYGSAPYGEPETWMSINEIIRYHGYPVENYQVRTDDGYTLIIQRIPYGKHGKSRKPGKPVLFQHGLFGNSLQWVLNTPQNVLPFMLADAGYDVWLGNVRGTIFGLKNQYYSTSNEKFWEFSFDEMVKYDIPCIIDKVLEKSNFSQIYYVGHSMGTTIAFGLLSSQPRYNEVIKTVFALGPIASVTHARGLAGLLIPILKQLQGVLNLFSYPLLTSELLVKILSQSLCSTIKQPCAALVFLFCGFDQEQFNETRAQVYFQHSLDVASIRNIVHFFQMTDVDEFLYYDFGANGNWEKYGQEDPPVYDLEAITTPVALFWGDNDYLADPRDVYWLENKLQNVILSYRVKYDKFSHMDFLWAKDVRNLLYNKVLDTFRKL